MRFHGLGGAYLISTGWLSRRTVDAVHFPILVVIFFCLFLYLFFFRLFRLFIIHSRK